MSKAEEYINKSISNRYNYNSYAQYPIPWLTPNNARRAVEIAREEMIEKACEFLANRANIPLWEGYNNTFGCDTSKLVKNFKDYMKGE